MSSIELKSRAKINLSIDVLGKREDGYHLVEMIMQTIDLYDIIKIKEIEIDEININSNSSDIPLNENNIVYKIPKKLYRVEKSNVDTNVKIPTQEELIAFEKNVKDIPNEFTEFRNLTIIKLFCGSGIRSEELIGLDMKDVFLQEESPYIMVWGKGNKEVQDRVPLSYEATDYLTEYFEYRKLFIEEKKEQNKSIDETPVFISNKGERISKGAIDDFFNDIAMI